MALIYIAVALAVAVLIAWLTRTYLPVPPGFRAILDVILGLIVIGMLLWLVNTYIPMAGSIKGLLNLVVLVACCVWVLKAFGLWGELMKWSRNHTQRRTPPQGI